MDQTGRGKGFLPDDNICKTVAAEKTTTSAVTDVAGESHAVAASTPVILDEEKTTYSTV